MRDTFDSVLCESPEYLKVLNAQSTKDLDWYDQESYDNHMNNTMLKFKEGKSQLDLQIIYTDQLSRG